MQLSALLDEASSSSDKVVEYLRERAAESQKTSDEYNARAKRLRGTERDAALRTASEARGEAVAYRDSIRAILKGP